MTLLWRALTVPLLLKALSIPKSATKTNNAYSNDL
jgi:hypothetical protein